MTEYRVELSQTAQADIYSIVRYIQTELQEPQIAGRLYRFLKEEIGHLSYLPERNAIVDLPEAREWGLRRLLVKNYSVFYMMDKAANTVRVVRIMYSGRDIARQLADTGWDD